MNTLLPMSVRIIQPPSIVEFCIFNPQWIDQRKAEDSSSLIQQVICHLTKNESGELVSDINDNVDEIVNAIGVITAIYNISNQLKSGNDDNIDYTFIDTDKSRTIVVLLNNNYYYFIKFQFAIKSVDDNSDNHEYTSIGLASDEYLKKMLLDAYDLFTLNHGKFDIDLTNVNDKNNLRQLTTQWWKIWLTNKFEIPSSFDLSDDGNFKLINALRYSSVRKPVGFTDNIDLKFQNTISENEFLDDIIVINTNWSPEKNWGVIYNNIERSKYKKSSIFKLITMFKNFDMSLGLSTYALTFGNWPSLLKYIDSLRRFDSIKPDGSLIERSIFNPSYSLINNVYNPFEGLNETINSYLPTVSTFQNMKSYVKPSLLTVSDITLHPWNTVTSYWKKDSENIVNGETTPVEENNSQHHNGGINLVNEDNDDSSCDDNGKYNRKGAYLLGDNNGTITLHDYYLQSKSTNKYEKINPIIYEINGMLFIYIYKPTDQLSQESFYDKLSKQIDSIYDTYFADLINNQLVSIKKDLTTDFTYLIYDDGKYWSSIDTIPPDTSTLIYQLPMSRYIREEQNISVLETTRILSLIQNKRIGDLLLSNNDENNEIYEKVVKLNQEQWCMIRRYNAKKWVLLIRNSKPGDIDIFGGDVAKWLEWVANDGYLN